MARLIKHALDAVGIGMAALCAFNPGPRSHAPAHDIYRVARQLSPTEVTQLMTSPDLYQCLLSQTTR